MALQLDVEPVAEHRLEAVETRLGERRLAVAQRAVDRTVGTAGQRDEALGMRGDDIAP